MIFLLIFSAMIWVKPAQAASIPNGFTTWSGMSTTDIHKTWLIKFNMPIDVNTINDSNVYMTDDSNRALSTVLTVSSDQTSVQISALSTFTPGSKYWIYITGGITADNGKQKLSQPLAIPFTVTGPISSVTDSYSSLITSFTVETQPNVYSVSINQNNMLYEGNNTFSLAMTNLKQGNKVVINAYDSAGRLLQSESYTVN